MISCSLTVISVFLPVFLAGPLEWKDHPEFSLKIRWKKPSLTLYFSLVHLSIGLLLISFQKLTTLQRKLIKSCNLKEDEESSPIENETINQREKKHCTNSKFSKDLGHLVRVFLKNFFKTFLGRKHIVFSWPNKALCTMDHLHVSQTKLAIRTEKAERDDKNGYKNQVFVAKTILNYLGTGNREFIRCSVLFAMCKITKQFCSKYLSRYDLAKVHSLRS